MEGEAKALAEVKKRSPEMAGHLDEWFGYVRQVQDIAGSAKYASKKVKNIYKAPKARKPKAKVKSVFTGRCDVDDKYCSGSKYTNPLG